MFVVHGFQTITAIHGSVIVLVSSVICSFCLVTFWIGFFFVLFLIRLISDTQRSSWIPLNEMETDEHVIVCVPSHEEFYSL